MTIRKPVGFDRQIKNFMGILQRSRGEGRAFLFYGPEGVGKFTTAVYLYAYLSCEANERPCGRCRTCRLIARNAHPDFRVMEPEGKGGEIRVDVVREVFISSTRYPPLENEWRMIVVDRAHAMNQSAQNAALKVLEEPPPRTLFVLVTANPWALLPTVRSRTVEIYFPPLSYEAFKQVMNELKIVVSEKEYAMSGGSPGFYLSIINDVSGQYSAAWEIVQMMEEKKTDPLRILETLSSHFRDRAVTTSFLNTFRWVILQKIREKTQRGEEAPEEIEKWLDVYMEISRWRNYAQSGQAFSIIAYEMMLKLSGM